MPPGFVLPGFGQYVSHAPLQVIVASREPASLHHIQGLGLSKGVGLIPGLGELFVIRDSKVGGELGTCLRESGD